jgi:pimeloyl-ACP methyl ester carboxylesterase
VIGSVQRVARRSGRVGPAGRLLIIAVVALLAVTACTASTPGVGTRSQSATARPSPASTAAPTIAFSDCSKLFDLNSLGLPQRTLKNLTVTCGKVPVPLDYDNAASNMIDIEVLKVHDNRHPKKIGPLLMNPGGPGAGGLTLPLDLIPSLSDAILNNFDLIGFDPRGVDFSSPINCVTDAQKDQLDALDPNLLTPDGFAQAKAANTAVAQECAAAYPTLADYNTVFTAMDMERIRLALGGDKLDYLGLSYGTELGAVYAHLYPAAIRAAVLDGAVDPTTDAVTSTGDQMQGFESAFDQFAADCLQRPACAVLGNPRQVVYQLTAAANLTPIPSKAPGETRAATGGIVLTGVLQALYDQSLWSGLGEALIQAQKGDSQDLFQLADQYNERSANGTYTNIYDANVSINCNDSPPGPTDQVIRATATTWATAYPMFGAWGAAALFQCQSWQPVRHPVPPVTATGAPPILVVGTTHDPATPYAGATHLAAALTTGQVLTWQGQGHTAYTKSTCIDTKVDNYLVTTMMPPAGTVCPA